MDDDTPLRPIRVPDPPAYVPLPPDPVEAEQIAQLEARGDLSPGEIIPEAQP